MSTFGPKGWSPPIHTYPKVWLKKCSGNYECTYASMESSLYNAGDHMTDTLLKNEMLKGSGVINTPKDYEYFKNLLRSSTKFPLMNVHQILDIDKIEKTSVTSCTLFGSDGSFNHCVAFYDSYLYDSNCDTAYPLTNQSLNWCVGSNNEQLQCMQLRQVIIMSCKNGNNQRRRRRISEKKKIENQNPGPSNNSKQK